MTPLDRGRSILVVGGTGRTGRRVLAQLLERGHDVTAIVRATRGLPPDLERHPRLALVNASLLALSPDALRRQVEGRDAVISCLGHPVSLKGVFGPPYDLVTRATARLCQAIRASRPVRPVRYVLMSSVSVNHPGAREARRGALEHALLATLRGLVPPARDNQRAADHLHREAAPGDPFVQWAVVRPDNLLEGGISAYALHESLVDSLFRPGTTRMANVAHFMCELSTDDAAWERWAGRLPVILDADGEAGRAPAAGSAGAGEGRPGG